MTISNELINCTGCYACVAICPKQCITMVSDLDGFWSPQIEAAKCVKCNKCNNCCPLNQKIEQGNKPVAYAAYNKNDVVRRNSSSGGVFTLLAEAVLAQGGCVFGAGFNSTFAVEHCCVDNASDLEELRGSKYVQSKIGTCFIEAQQRLRQGGLVLFSGTPCQIAGLKSFLGQEYPNLICQDLICHGVASPKVWQHYLNYRKNAYQGKLQRAYFRNKRYGWRRFSLCLQSTEGEYIQDLNTDLFLQLYLKNYILRPSCYHCKFKTLHRQADITLADFWGIDKVLPDFNNDEGVSLLLIHSKKGQNLYQTIADNMMVSPVSAEAAIKHNSAVIKPIDMPRNRADFFVDFNEKDFDGVFLKYTKDTLVVCIKKVIRKCINTFCR